MDDLNKICIPNADGDPTPLRDFSMSSGNIEVVFRNVKERLIAEILRSEVVLGCVAWLTDSEILEALSKVSCSIVVQKEDFLRPDLGVIDENWKANLRKSYDSLRFKSERYALPGVGGFLSTASDPGVGAVRCVGNHNSQKKSAFPRMHNKFVVFGKIEVAPVERGYSEWVVPCSVWTGSYNFTKNAGRSFENAVILSGSEISSAYANEYAQIFALSESLDWSSPWVEPEFRIGT
ncbi:hypothetical protein [Bdellovibrio bacteriovorus]|uniref:hypothetical protein n=1 Tax=Bdellovibrio bacteriovorus TaxID=959 RepID=UPI0035A6F08F